MEQITYGIRVGFKNGDEKIAWYNDQEQRDADLYYLTSKQTDSLFIALHSQHALIFPVSEFLWAETVNDIFHARSSEANV